MRKIDVVYVLGNGSAWDNMEIRYSLRSVAKHLKGYRNIIIAGEYPSFLRGIMHIPLEDEYKYKVANSTSKLLATCRCQSLSDEFLFFNDDFFLLQDTAAPIFPYYHKGRLWDSITRRNRKITVAAVYTHAMKNTIIALRDKELPTLNYSVHCPMRIDRWKLLNIFSQYDLTHQYGYLTRSLYGNHLQLEAIEIQDCNIKRELPPDKIRSIIKDKPWFAISHHGMTQTMVGILEELYPKPSPWEIT